MTRLIRSNLTPVALALLALLPAALGAASGLVRCEHSDATAHVAQANHHQQPAEASDCCCGSEHGEPDSDQPADHPDVPCDDTPIGIELVPAQQYANGPDMPDAPLLPVFVWESTEPMRLGASPAARFAGQPPGLVPGLAVVETTIFRL